MDDELPKPGIEPIGIAETRQISPGSDEPVLNGIARELPVSEDQSRRRVQARDRRTGKRREGVMIAPPRSLDEVALVHGSLWSWRDRAVALR